MSKAERKTHYLSDYQPADFAIDTVHMHVDLFEHETIVKTILKVRRNSNADAPLMLHGRELKLKSVIINGLELENKDYHADSEHLTIPNVPDEFTIETEVVIYPQDNTALMGLYQSGGNFCTQCEAQGFRHITYYLDRPDVMSRFTTTISADKDQYPMLLSNGNLIETRELENNRHWVHWEDPSKKPSYLFALVAGDFDLLVDTFTTMSGRQIDLRLYLEKGHKDQGAFALEALKHAMRWDEQTFGREYDLDIYMIVAVSDFNMGAMENKGLNVFNTKYVLAKDETATDVDYAAIETVIGHEYFHNWTGNRVTLRDWFQITLKEGLTVFRDQSFSQDMTSAAVSRINEVNVMRNQQFSEDASRMAHPIRPDSYIEINNFYTSTVYRKGSEVIRMIQTLLGKETFRKAMDIYFERFDGQAVTTEDFVSVMEEASGRDLSQFSRWYHQAGTPELEIDGNFDAAQSRFVLTVRQYCPATPGQKQKSPFHLPLKIALIGEDCEEIPLQLKNEKNAVGSERILEITEPTQEFEFINVTQKPVPSLLRGFSAPVKLHYNYDRSELACLLRCDSDTYSRWDAAQEFVVNIIAELTDQHAREEALSLDPLFVETYAEILEQDFADLNLLHRLLVLPAENYLLQEIETAGVEAIYAAREHVLMQLAFGLLPQLLEQYEKHQQTHYEFNVQAMGERSVKNTCLAYLLMTKQDKYFDLAYSQFQDSTNMTDMVGALAALNHHDCPQRGNALAQFYEKWQSEALVVNKWLLLQSSSKLPNTLNKVEQLLTHSAFDIHNPNNVYSLLCGFGANTVRFHDSGGKSYRFMADQVLKIDAQNPQVAARTLTPLTRWQGIDDVRITLMREQLQRIIDHSGLSPDVYEVVHKSLE